MAQGDMNIANQGFPAFRADLNDQLEALVTNSSGATAPATTFPHQWWLDTSTTPSTLRQRNAANDAWIVVGLLNQSTNTFNLPVAQGGTGAADAGGARTNLGALASTDPSYTGTLTGGTGVINIGSGQLYKDASGNVGIGTSSPISVLSSNGNITAVNYGKASLPRIVLEPVDNGPQKISPYGTGVSAEQQLAFCSGVSADERMRIDSSGNLSVGATDAQNWRVRVVGSGAVGFLAEQTGAGGAAGKFQRNTENGNAISFSRGGADVGTISITTTNTAYNTSSDYRLKEDWQPMSGAITRLNQLKPVNFAWKVDGSRVDGFLAHEAQEVVPESVTGTKDDVEAIGNITDAEGNIVQEGVTEPQELAEGQVWTQTGERPVYQGIDQAKLVPLLTAALQEAVAKIAALEARLDAANL
jgi:hypothetical protein